MVSLICCDKEYAEIDESQRKVLHDDILSELGIVEKKKFIWGTVSSGHDVKSNS